MRAVWIVLALLLVALPARPADDDETVLPTARADRLVDLVGVSMEGIEHG